MKKTPSLKRERVKRYSSKEMAQLNIILVIFIITAAITGLIWLKDTYQIGYGYYKDSVLVGVTQEEKFLEDTIHNYLEQLTEDGYTIINNHFDIDYRTKIIKKEDIKNNNKEEMKKIIIDNIQVTIKIFQLVTKDDLLSYYFKTEEECNKFLDTLNQYIKQEDYLIQEISGDISLISTEEELNSKIEKVKEQKKAISVKRQNQTVSVSRGGNTKRYNVPMESYILISSPYGMRNGSMHTGVDLAAAAGTKIYAWKSGIVTFAGWYGNYGYFIAIEHEDGTISRYAHCSKINVTVGDTIDKNQIIGYVGSTGRSTGPHLHFEILINGAFVNPLNYL